MISFTARAGQSRKIATFRQSRELIDEFIYFYNHERIQLKTGVAPLTQRHSA